MYRVGIIGTGSFANAHAEALQSLGDRVKIVAAADPTRERGVAFCEMHRIPTYYPNAAALHQDARPDLVHICTPPDIHARLAEASLHAGAHVICEKPLCGSLSDFDGLRLAETLSGKTLSTIFQWRFGSAAQKLKQMIDSGALGELRVAVCHTLWYRDDDYYAVAWRGSWDRALGGTLMGHGIHLIDLLLWLIPDWQEVYARVRTFDFAVEIENLGAALVSFDNGAQASIISSAVSPRQETYLRLDFQKATVEVRGLYRYDNEHWTLTSDDAALTAEWERKPNIPNTLAAQIAATLDKLDRGERPPVSGDEARRILDFLTATYKSAFTGQPIRSGAITPADPFYHSMRGSNR
jgi:predicted dehydrogenase